MSVFGFLELLFVFAYWLLEGVTSDYEEILWLRFERRKESVGHGGEGASE